MLAQDLSNYDRILNIQSVIQLTTLSRDSIYRLARKGYFPKPKKIGINRSGWLESDIKNYINEKFKEDDIVAVNSFCPKKRGRPRKVHI